MLRSTEAGETSIRGKSQIFFFPYLGRLFPELECSCAEQELAQWDPHVSPAPYHPEISSVDQSKATPHFITCWLTCFYYPILHPSHPPPLPFPSHWTFFFTATRLYFGQLGEWGLKRFVRWSSADPLSWKGQDWKQGEFTRRYRNQGKA